MSDTSENFVDQRITDTLEQNYMPYVMSVIVSRAIPEIDGFKPSHRKILYTMLKMKLLGGSRTKSANVVGQTMKLNPHGDQAIYATLVRLTRGNEALLLPYVDSKGNFGKVTSRDMKYAAPRYTEVRLDPVCEALFRDIDKNTVDFVDNYDGNLQEPTLLPTVFPNILANPNKGIAVGMASNFPSFNLQELCEATIAFIEDSAVDIMEIMPAPDFSTGGRLLYDREQMASIYASGLGTFKLRGNVAYDERENMLEITEIPYTATVEQIIEKIVELVKSGKLKEVSDVRDETDLKGLKIAVDLKRGTDADKVIAKLFKYTPMEDSFSCNFNLLINGRPKVLGIKGILTEWLLFRRSCIKRAAEFDSEKLGKKLHVLYGLKNVLLDIDRAIEIIRGTEKDARVVPNLMSAFAIDDVQANYVADIKLRNLNKEYLINRIEEIAAIEKNIEALKALAGSQRRIDAAIVKDLKGIIQTYVKPRMTQLVSSEAVVQHVPETHVEDYNLKVFLTAHNYLKKIPLVSLRSSGDHKMKEEDEILQEIEGTNRDEILFFTNRHTVYKMKMHEIEDQKTSNLGVYLPNILELEPGEEVLFCVLTSTFDGFMIFGFENGKVAKVPLSAYQTKTNRKRLVKAYSDVSPLVRMHFFREDKDLTAIRSSSREMRALIFNTALIPEKVTKNTRGVQVVRLKKGSAMSALLETEKHTFSDVERYYTQSIPKSGEELDPIEKMNCSNWIRL